MAASDYVPIFFKNRLHLAGRPQMSPRPKKSISSKLGTRPFKNYLSNCGIVAIGLTVAAHAMGRVRRRWPFPVPVATSNTTSNKMRKELV